MTMKLTKFKKYIISLAALLIAVAAMTACSSENTIADEPIVKPDAPKTYTMTVQATKEGAAATTRALGFNGTALDATWTAGDKVTVMKYTTSYVGDEWKIVGQLSATNVSADGHSCTLTGDLDATMMAAAGYLTAGDKLRLVFPGGTLSDSYSMSYTGQDGKLSKIATNYDYCSTPSDPSTAVQVTAVSGNSITTSNATFTNNQAIVRFTLTDKNGNAIEPTSLTISAKDGTSEELIISERLTGTSTSPGTGVLIITPDGTTNEVYVALRGFSNKNISLKAVTASNEYSYTKMGVTFTDGKYYTISVKMKNDLVDLGGLTDDYIAQDGDILTGTLPSGIHLSIAAGVTVTLKDVIISDDSQAGITCLGNANIILSGTNMNSVTSTANEYPGIQAAHNGTGSGDEYTLTISGSGSLTATGGSDAAGIGSGKDGSCGNITINGGTVTATGGSDAAGIGSGNSGSCGNIEISDGTVTAKGGSQGAGIGSGHSQATCGDITISGGTVIATGGSGAAGIGSGSSADACGNITITENIVNVTATKGSVFPEMETNYCIGLGANSTDIGTITIDGTTEWTAGTPTEHLKWGDGENASSTTWTLTPKTTN